MKFNKKGTLVLGSALLSAALLAQPAFAATNQKANCINVQQFMNWGKMQSIMSSSMMQQAMQKAMQSGDFTEMREAMNSSEMMASHNSSATGYHMSDSHNSMMNRK